MFKLTIVNKTHWQTRQLRKIALTAIKREFSPEEYGKNLQLIVNYGKGSENFYSSGCAYLNSHVAEIHVSSKGVDPCDFASTVVHEVGHSNLGLKHDKMRGNCVYRREVPGHHERYEWARVYKIERVAKKLKVRKSAFDKLSVAEAGVKKWERKLKLANTKLKLWKKKVKYYEKQRHNGSDIGQAVRSDSVGDSSEARAGA